MLGTPIFTGKSLGEFTSTFCPDPTPPHFHSTLLMKVCTQMGNGVRDTGSCTEQGWSGEHTGGTVTHRETAYKTLIQVQKVRRNIFNTELDVRHRIKFLYICHWFQIRWIHRIALAGSKIIKNHKEELEKQGLPIKDRSGIPMFTFVSSKNCRKKMVKRYFFKSIDSFKQMVKEEETAGLELEEQTQEWWLLT